MKRHNLIGYTLSIKDEHKTSRRKQPAFSSLYIYADKTRKPRTLKPRAALLFPKSPSKPRWSHSGYVTQSKDMKRFSNKSRKKKTIKHLSIGLHTVYGGEFTEQQLEGTFEMAIKDVAHSALCCPSVLSDSCSWCRERDRVLHSNWIWCRTRYAQARLTFSCLTNTRS